MKPSKMLIFNALLVVSAQIGCVRGANGKYDLDPFRSKSISHEVRYEGETLGQIAAWYTGEQGNWREIASANPDVNPKAMRVGTRIAIPEKLVVRRDPLPRRAAAAVRPKEMPVADSLVAQTTSAAPPQRKFEDESLQSEILRDRLQEALLQR